jgi:hypothetical protein
VAILPFTWRYSDGHVANAAFSSFFSCNPSFTFGAASFCDALTPVEHEGVMKQLQQQSVAAAGLLPCEPSRAQQRHHPHPGEGNEPRTARSAIHSQPILEPQRVDFPLHLLIALPDQVRLEVHIVHLLLLLLVQPLHRFLGLRPFAYE